MGSNENKVMRANIKDGLTTCEKGDIGVLMVSADLINQGVSVFNPCTESAAYDIIAKYEGQYYEIQVKYRAIDNSRGRSGAIQLSPRRVNIKSKGDVLQNNYVVNKQFDILAVYCPELPKGEDVAYVRPDEYGESLSLRTTPPIRNIKTMNNKKILFFKDFLRFDRLFEQPRKESKERLTRLNRLGQEVKWTITPFNVFSKREGKQVKKFRVVSGIKKGIKSARIDRQLCSYKEAVKFINHWEKTEAELRLRNT